MFVEALTPIAGGISDVTDAVTGMNKMLYQDVEEASKIQASQERAEMQKYKAETARINAEARLESIAQKNRAAEMSQYRAETARMNAEAKLGSIAYANRLADMAEKRGVHTANMAGRMNDMLYGSPLRVQIGPQPISYR